MPLHLHRAERTDLLADGLGALLANPLADPFATELVVVPARGVERWLSQRLSHVLGARGGDGVCAGVAFRSPGSLIAEITGTADNDPWSPDAMAWPLLEAIDCSLDEPWCRAGWRACSTPTRASARNCSSTGATATPAISTRTCAGSPSCGAHWWRGSPPTRRISGRPRPSRGCERRPASCRHGSRCSGTP